VLGIELPVRFRREIDPLPNELRAVDEQGSGIGQSPRNGLGLRWTRVRSRHGVVHLKLPLSPMVEKAERRVASLLDFRYHESWTDGVDRAGWDENNVVFQDAAPLNEI